MKVIIVPESDRQELRRRFRELVVPIIRRINAMRVIKDKKTRIRGREESHE